MDLDQYRKIMKEQAELDKMKKQAQVSGDSLQDVLEHASIELSLPIKNISYEILQRGRKGFFGVGRREYVIIAYQSELIKAGEENPNSNFSEFEIDDEVKLTKSVDGRLSICCVDEQAFLNISAPEGNGQKVKFLDAQKILQRRGIANFDEALIRKSIKDHFANNLLVASYIHNSSSDAMLDISISEDSMTASIIMSEPGPGGQDITESFLSQYLRDMNVVFGINTEFLKDLIRFPQYTKQVLIAEGRSPIDGSNATIKYLFETDKSKLMPKEVDGRVDFKNMHLIQNVVEGQVLAEKIEAKKGVDGLTVTGASIPAKDGIDVPLISGENVVVSDDGTSLIAKLNGQVLLSETGRISVAPVYTVSGDVNLKNSGNIDFIGTVIVKGSVEDGYFLKASKNIEVNGTVGKCTLESGEDILVARGIAGKEDGKVLCGGNLLAKFIENAKVVTQGNIIVKDGIVNSEVDSNSSIYCLDGRHAAIVGGKIRASHKVVAKTIGSPGSAETIIEVGFDPQKRLRCGELEQRIIQINKALGDIDLNIKTIMRTKNTKAGKEKIDNLKNLKLKKFELDKELNDSTEELSGLKEYLESLKDKGSVSVEGRIYPGVKLNISGAEFRVKNELKWTTFYKEGPVVRFKEFSESRDVNETY